MSVEYHVKSANPKIATMQYFSSQTCSYCKKFDPVFAGLATGSLPSQGVEFVCIDVTPKKDGGKAAKQNGINQFPTVRLIADGQTITYPSSMPRDHDNMSLWLVKNLYQLSNAGTYKTWNRSAATARAGDPYMDQQASLHGNDRASAYVPARDVYGRNNTNLKYRKSAPTPFQQHRNTERHDASQYSLSFAAADLNSNDAIRSSYDSMYQQGQTAGPDTSNYAILNLGTDGDIAY